MVIPEGVTSIGRTAFCGCDDVLTVTIPPIVTKIGVNALGAKNISTIYVCVGDSDRVKSLLRGSELDISRLNFLEIGESFTIRFDANGGVATLSEKQCGGDVSVWTLPTASRPGYLFEGLTVTVHGKGTFVAEANREKVREEQLKEIEAEFCQTIQKGKRYGLTSEEIKEIFLIQSES